MEKFHLKLDQFIDQHQKLIYTVFFALVLLAYLHQSGITALFADEPIRATVALEMMFSGNYWVPTLTGEFYYKKPPFYNWLIIGVFKLFGHQYSEFVFRLPSTVPLGLYAFSIYYWFKDKMGLKVAFFGAASFVLCGRFVVYSGLLGHIDVFYSYLTFAAFYIQVKALEKQKWWAFFIWPYLLHSVGFLCKGLPSILFSGITPVALLLYFRHYKRLFDYRHFLGMALFVLPLLLYFLKYAQYNELMGWVDQLWDQSKQRTVMDKSWWQSIGHLFTFPLDHFMHLAPVFCFFPLVFLKKVRHAIRSNFWWRAMLVVFLANLPPYWLSPGYYPRYLFMLYPIVMLWVSKAYFEAFTQKYTLIVERVLAVLLMLAPVLLLVLPMIVRPTLQIDLWFFKYLVCAVILLACGFFMWKRRQHHYLFLVIALLGFKLYLNWFILEDRIQAGDINDFKEEVIPIAEKYEKVPLFVYGNSAINLDAVFYIERHREEILYRQTEFKAGDYVICAAYYIEELGRKYHVEKVDSFLIRHEKSTLSVFKVLGIK